MVGGAFALESYTGLVRRTKDLDVFALREDVDGLMRFLAAAGYETEVRFPHWISKAHKGGHVIDIIFGSGNGVCAIDQKWFDAAPTATIMMGERVRLVPAEEMIWSKAFIMELSWNVSGTTGRTSRICCMHDPKSWIGDGCCGDLIVSDVSCSAISCCSASSIRDAACKFPTV